MTINSHNKIKERVQKLLNQAADRQGTPEGETFYEKAFELMANYGFDERDLAAPDDGDSVTHRKYVLDGSYTEMQGRLLNSIAMALHCVGFSTGIQRSTRIAEVTLFGVRRHLDRVDLLFSLLNPRMIAEAQKLRGDPELGISTVVTRRSFMVGFSNRIGERLHEAEQTVSDAHNGYAIALLSDEEKAEAARQEFAEAENLHFHTKNSRAAISASAYARGVHAGSTSDIGQTRMNQRRALPA
ncbi:DUF2786 domain-containing protein [Corynebacterium breve]|uniref:DUF2786 domain-containing protein n=1 Tax=Corynebacterium breve TaxID=3049799 RepID=A0ABY8VG66_9CORY|nr:DUF2786 domain-containing protein [Corynebacterium breve]WIM68102.1 DUF2786 domain-containing protein [Corynebacterium breve]